jgi:hypothetical protein
LAILQLRQLRRERKTISKPEAKTVTTTQQREDLNQIGKSATESIRELLAINALDWARLEQLTDDRDGHDEEDEGATWSELYPDDAEELAELEETAGDCEGEEDARTRLDQDPLEITFRSGWCSSRNNLDAEEFSILLTTGGPAVRIRGELDIDGDVYRAWLEVSDWGQPWTEYNEPGTAEDVKTYSQHFVGRC